MTEEEWTQRVDELNKHQVGAECNAGSLSSQVQTNNIMFCLAGMCICLGHYGPKANKMCDFGIVLPLQETVEKMKVATKKV